MSFLFELSMSLMYHDFHLDLLNALKQTKIVRTISKSAISANKQLKPTDKKVARGAADLGALESFLTHKVKMINVQILLS